jgi:3-hydroxy-9,10-secoandrosta-1,3,5(10)-triene-9,17-dione monooxygenase reductase component
MRIPAGIPLPLHEAVPVDAKALRGVCGHFVTGVTVVTSGLAGTAAGATVNSFTSVSLEPPLVLFCLHNQSRLRPVVENCGVYVVNFLAGRQKRLAWAFAERDTADLRDVAHHHASTGVPVLSEALAFLSCRLVDRFEGGDHAIFLGEVVELGLPSRHAEPLIFFRGSLSALEDEQDRCSPIFDG